MNKEIGYEWKYCLSLLLDPGVSEIESNGPSDFFCKRSGKREKLSLSVAGDEEYFEGIEKALLPHVRHVIPWKRQSYLFEGPLDFRAKGERIRGRCHIVLPPASDYPQITIAKKSTSLTDLDSIAGRGSMSSEMLSLIKAAVKANLTLAFSGGTGAGKALHKNTLIPTPDGWKKVSELSVGDVIFSIGGNRTNIVNKYCPHDDRSFEITFENGEVMKTSAGHLWTVIDNGVEKVVSTLNMFENPDKYLIPSLRAPITLDNKNSEIMNCGYLGEIVSGVVDEDTKDAVLAGLGFHSDTNKEDIILEVCRKSESDRVNFILGAVGYVGDEIITVETSDEKLSSAFTKLVASLGWFVKRDGTSVEFSLPQNDNYHKCVNIVEIDDNPEDYFCFEVDDDSHLFLAGESCIPTHNTTMLEACTKLIPNNVRIGVAEDTPELSLVQDNVTYLHSVPWRPGMNPNDEATLSWVVQQFQRMRTDRLIIGETRGKEFADFLTAANSGMEGSMTTIHANDPVRCLDKMTNFALKGSDKQPVRTVNSDIANAVDLIIQLIILPNGFHKVDAIQEITNTVGNGEDAKITTNPLYIYDRVNDCFLKENQMTDSMRNHFQERGVNISEFLNTPMGTRQDSHLSSVVKLQNAHSGLPKARHI